MSTLWVRLPRLRFQRHGDEISVRDPLRGATLGATAELVRALGMFENPVAIEALRRSHSALVRRMLDEHLATLHERGWIVPATSASTAGALLARPLVEYSLGAAAPDFSTFERTSVHRRMVSDRTRTHALRRALCARVTPGMTVLDIGSGCGVLAMFAATAGAKHVYAIEATAVARAARTAIARSGFAERITVIEGLADTVEIPAPIDLLVSETLGHVGFDEGILAVGATARQMLRPDAPIIPSAFSVMCAPVLCPSFHRDVVGFWDSSPFGLDLSVMGARAIETAYLGRFYAEDYQGEPAILLRATVGDPVTWPLGGEVRITVTKGGAIDGLALWFDATLAPGIELSSRDCPSWHQAFLPLRAPLTASPGEILHLRIAFYSDSRADGITCRWSGGVGDDPARRFRNMA